MMIPSTVKTTLRIAPVLVLLLAATLTLWSQDQNTNLFKGIISAGPVLAQIDGDGPAGYDYLGYRAGLGTFFFIKKQWLSTGLEFFYANRGSRTSYYRFYNGEAGSFRFSADYLEAPITLNLHDKGRLMARVGLIPGFPIRSHLDFKSAYGAVIEGPPGCLTNELKKFDLSLLAGMYFIIKKGWVSASPIPVRSPASGHTAWETQKLQANTTRSSMLA